MQCHRSKFPFLMVIPVAASLLTGACSDSPDRIAFSSLTIAEQQRMLLAAAGVEALALVIVGGLIQPPSTCPTVDDQNSNRTIRGGCAENDGTTWYGDLTISPFPPDTEVSLTAHEFGFLESGVDPDKVIFDGSVSFTQGVGFDADVIVESEAARLRTDEQWEFASGNFNGGVKVKPGGTVELIGVGYADVVAEWNASGNTGSGSIELHGRDVLSVDVSQMTADCAPMLLDGTRIGELCDF